MINKIKIQNFKSIVDLTIDLGRINVIVGPNGSGKTNILEAITFASAARQNKLDNEYLFNRGIRVTTPEYMKSAFDTGNTEKTDTNPTDTEDQIVIEVLSEKPNPTKACIVYDETIKKWKELSSVSELEYILKNLPADPPEETLKKLSEYIKTNPDDILSFSSDGKELSFENHQLNSFLTYNLIESVLRDANSQSPIRPLGINGQGLLQYLKEVSQNKDNKTFIEDINEGLFLLDWFDGFTVPDSLLSNEYKLSIGDRYLNESLRHFDQQSTNEGFLYLLFYLTLFNSKESPSFFAVDNIESSFNPRLCSTLMEHLVKVAKKKEKQVILTTHSPYILDGMDLSDEEQRLFVARRDIDGYTKIERIPHREDRNMLLSELWMSGLYGNRSLS